MNCSEKEKYTIYVKVDDNCRIGDCLVRITVDEPVQ